MLTTQSVAAFASKPFVQKSLSDPFSVKSVLSFFFGVDYDDPAQVDKGMRRGVCLAKMMPFWFGAHEDYDLLCKQHFAETVRAVAAGAGSESGKGKGEGGCGGDASGNGPFGDEWETTVDGKIAQLILCDQLSRNCFRGTAEAFAYDQRAFEICLDLCDRIGMVDGGDGAGGAAAAASLSTKGGSIVVPSLNDGELYPPYIAFMTINLNHSESLHDHAKAEKLCKAGEEITAASEEGGADDAAVKDFWKKGSFMLNEHTDVIKKFGRYPHRNNKLNRTSTEEEITWLSNKDELPDWAKSQI